MLRVRTAINGFVGGPGLMTHYFETPLQNEAACLRVVGYVRNALIYGMAADLPDAASLQVSGDVDVITAANGEITNTYTVETPTVWQGTGGESQAPAAVAALIRLGTSTFLAGRRVRGRTFLSPLAAAVVNSDGILTASGAANPLVGTDAFFSTVEAGDTWVVWHRPKDGVGGEAAPITNVSVPLKLAVLVSRRD